MVLWPAGDTSVALVAPRFVEQMAGVGFCPHEKGNKIQNVIDAVTSFEKNYVTRPNTKC
jgi:hypothetical protein